MPPVPRSICISNGRIIDPSRGIDEIGDLWLSGGQIAESPVDAADADDLIVDADGLVVAPGLIDLHVHLREPGYEYKETIRSGSEAAAAGGFTTICCMPNTLPALDTVEAVQDQMRRIAETALVRVHPIATISKKREGWEPVDYAGLVAAGAIGFSDDGDSTRSLEVMSEALEASRELGVPVMVHCEDWTLIGGAMHDGDVSAALGIPGIPAAAEEAIIERDISLAEATGGWLHLLHVSTGKGAELVRAAKARGLHVTAEVMPHHLTMIDAWVAGDRQLVNTDEPAGARGRPVDPNTKVNPPLRPRGDAEALLVALKLGVFDIVATDHAPHGVVDKEDKSFVAAVMGFNASEVALPIMLALVRAGHLSLNRLLQLMTCAPAKFLRDGTGTLEPGAPADVVVFDPEQRWLVTPDQLKSKSKNTPLMGMELQGRVKMTIASGRVVHDDR